MDIADIRKDYKLKSFDEAEANPDAIAQFEAWWNEAVSSKIDEVNAMTLATVSVNGMPHARIVLLKGFDEKGFRFFTNYTSHKGNEMEANPNVALVFFWKELERQIRIEGIVEKLDEAESEAYFISRPAASKIGAWASSQSETIVNRSILEENVQKFKNQFGNDIPKPPHWGGYLVKPVNIEFWQGRRSRLHDRLVYTKQENSWKIERLAP